MATLSNDIDLLTELVIEREIRLLLALYPRFADDSDTAGFAELFVPDGILRVAGDPITGHTAIATWMAATSAAGPLRHIMANAQTVITSRTEAHGSVDMILLKKPAADWIVVAAPRYEDRYLKVQDGWRFAERELTFR